MMNAGLRILLLPVLFKIDRPDSDPDHYQYRDGMKEDCDLNISFQVYIYCVDSIS